MSNTASGAESSDGDAMAAEFDTLAAWTAEAALALGPDHLVPAGCRGSGRPAALDWLLDRMDVSPGQTLLDVGAGVGGPSAYAAHRNRVRPVLLEPTPGACGAARQLFDLPVVRADATALPVHDSAVSALWSLGVLCTLDDQLASLRELHRVLSGRGRGGLLVFTAAAAEPPGAPEGNNFPSNAQLLRLISEAGLLAVDQTTEARLAPEPAIWRDRAEAVDAEIERRHGDRPEWKTALQQSSAMGRLLSGGDVVARLVVVARRPR